mgnify:CR=1 FL=1
MGSLPRESSLAELFHSSSQVQPHSEGSTAYWGYTEKDQLSLLGVY